MSALGGRPQKNTVRSKNRILLILAEQESWRLAPHPEELDLPLRMALSESGSRLHYAYFMNSGMTSLIAHTQDGNSEEVGVVGNEGMVGIPVVPGRSSMPSRTVVWVAGDCLRIRSDALEDKLKRNVKPP